MKILTSVCFVALSLFSFGQATDTLGVTPGSTPAFAPNNQVTIIPYATYGYVFGTQNDGQNVITAVGQGYVNTDPAYVGGALAFVAKKAKGPQNVPNVKVTFELHNIIPGGCFDILQTGQQIPGPATAILTSADLFYEELDTTLGVYSGVQFPQPILVNGDLAIMVNINELRAAGDTLAFFSDNINDANNLNYAFLRGTAGAQNFYVSANQLFNNALNNNVAIFPVLVEAPSANGTLDFAGIRTMVYPNPATESVTVELPNLSSDCTVKLISSRGEIIATRAVASSQGLTSFDTRELAQGNYVLVFETAQGARFARTLLIHP